MLRCYIPVSRFVTHRPSFLHRYSILVLGLRLPPPLLNHVWKSRGEEDLDVKVPSSFQKAEGSWPDGVVFGMFIAVHSDRLWRRAPPFHF